MNKEFIPYEQALELKELDYDKPCFGWYHDNILEVDFKIRANEIIKHHELLGRFKGCCLAPTFSQAFRFFREKYGIDVVIGAAYDKGKTFYLRIETGPTSGYQYFDSKFKTYEEAELACLIKMIEIKKKYI
jgi:hypothetical protein